MLLTLPFWAKLVFGTLKRHHNFWFLYQRNRENGGRWRDTAMTETQKHRKDKRGEWLQSRWGARRSEWRKRCALSIIHQCCAELTPVASARCDIHSCTLHSSLYITPVCSDVFLLTDSGIIIHTAHSLQWVLTHAHTLTCGCLHKPASWQAYVRTHAQWFHPEMVDGSE